METTHDSKPSVGTLYLIGTPIGNLEDMTVRGLRTMREVDLLAAEDTRRLRQLLTKFEISKPSVSYHKFSEKKVASQLVSRMLAGQNVGLVSDAGMPCISDPGNELVCQCIENGITVVPIPGPCAIDTALCASGLNLQEFVFLGFLPKKTAQRAKTLAPYAGDTKTLVVFESPYRIESLLEDVLAALGDRRVVLARELTKLYEEFIRGRISEVLGREIPEKGEFVLVIEGAPPKPKEKKEHKESRPGPTRFQ